MIDHSGVSPRDPYEDAINVRDWVRLAWRRRRLIGGTACAGVLIAAAIAFVTPRSYAATIRLFAGQDISPELAPSVVAKYRILLDEPWVSRQVVDELGLEKPPYGLSAARFQSEALASTVDAAGSILIEVRMSDRGMAVRAANAVALRTVELARRREERSRILDDVAPILKLKLELPTLLANIQTEETGLRVLEQQMQNASLRNVSLQTDVVLRRVRLAQLRAKWDQINSGLQTASELLQRLGELSPTDGIPPEITAKLESLDQGFAVAPDRRREFQPPLRVLAEAAVSGPAPWRSWATYLALGLMLGLMLPLVGTVFVFVLSAGRKPNRSHELPQ